MNRTSASYPRGTSSIHDNTTTARQNSVMPATPTSRTQPHDQACTERCKDKHHVARVAHGCSKTNNRQTTSETDAGRDLCAAQHQHAGDQWPERAPAPTLASRTDPETSERRSWRTPSPAQASKSADKADHGTRLLEHVPHHATHPRGEPCNQTARMCHRRPVARAPFPAQAEKTAELRELEFKHGTRLARAPLCPALAASTRYRPRDAPLPVANLMAVSTEPRVRMVDEVPRFSCMADPHGRPEPAHCTFKPASGVGSYVPVSTHSRWPFAASG